MKVTIDVQNSKFQVFIAFLKTLDYVKVDEEIEESKDVILNNIKEAVEEMKLIKEGKLKGIPAKDLLDEL